MAFTNTWDEASPPGTDFARTADDHLRKSKTDIRERGGVEHITYVTEGANTDVWEHKSGQCKVAYVGTKATFPAATNKKGAIAIASDEGNTYISTGTAGAETWKQLPVVYMGTKATFPTAGNKGTLAIATDEGNRLYSDNGTTWVMEGQQISILSGTVAHGGTIPLPTGYTQDQCKWMVSMYGGNITENAYLNQYYCYADANRVVTCYIKIFTGPSANVYYTYYLTANYMIIGIK